MLADRATRQRVNKALRRTGAKCCARCHVIRAASQFGPDKCKADGLRAYCRVCASADSAARRASNPEYHREYDARKRAERDPQFYAARRASDQRRRARKRNAAVDVFSEQEMLNHWAAQEAWACLYCGAPWEQREHDIPLARGGAHSLDNHVPACTDCNLRKGTRTGVEFGAQIAPRWFETMRRLSACSAC